MVVGGAVVGGAVVLGTVVVVGRGAAVVGGAVVAGRVVGGAVTAEVRGTVGETTPASEPTVELVVVDSRTVVSGVPILLPAPAAAAAVVETGQGRPPHPGGAPCPPNACTARTTTIPAVATPVATHGRLASHPPTPVPPVAALVEPPATQPRRGPATQPSPGRASPGPPRRGHGGWGNRELRVRELGPELRLRELDTGELGSCELRIREPGTGRAVFAAVHSHPTRQFADLTRLAARDQLGAEALHELGRRGEHVLGDGTA